MLMKFLLSLHSPTINILIQHATMNENLMKFHIRSYVPSVHIWQTNKFN